MRWRWLIGLFLVIFSGSYLIGLEYRRCRIVEAGGHMYWVYIHRTVNHGICANLYGGDSGLWELDVPNPSGGPTSIYLFNSSDEGRKYADQLCATRQTWGRLR